MGKSWLVACAVAVALVPVVLTQSSTYGTATNGVKLRIEIQSQSGAELWITVQNVGDKPLLVPIGNLYGADQHLLRFQVFLTAPDGRDRRLAYTGGPGAIAGRLDPLVIPLVPKASYELRISLALFYDLDTSKTLEALLHSKGRLRVELDVQKPNCTPYGCPDPSVYGSPKVYPVPCWEGKAVSNLVQLPH